MPRTQLSPQRSFETKKVNIGHIIVFCEGQTEEAYLRYFLNIIKKNKYTDINIFLKPVGGNSQTVLKYAKKFMQDSSNNQKFNNYNQYLLFDCDEPQNIQTIISAASEYTLLISNYSFETWLLMHFEDLQEPISKSEILQHLSLNLSNGYSKGSDGIIREIINNGDVEKAIENAKALDGKYTSEGKSIFANIKEMNPYTSVYKLIEQFMLEIS